MGKEESLRYEGEVVELLPNATFRVVLDESKHKILGHLGGKMRQHSINILLGDRVRVEMSIYDMSKGRIIFRL